MRNKARRITAVVAMAASLGIAAAPAYANWTSYISDVGPGFQSHRWSDSHYTQVLWRTCYDDWGTQGSAVVDMRHDINNWPDTSYGTHTFSKCFNGPGSAYTSNTYWNGLVSGHYYFQIDKVSKDNSGLLSVKWVYQDTTLKD